MEYFLSLLYALLPVILGGVFNMIFVKVGFLSFLKRPMDNGAVYRDGKRWFGDNKTWKGFIGMILFTTIFTGLSLELADAVPAIKAISIFSQSATNYWLLGAILGLGYVLAELPNSFMKRRIDIQPGTNVSGVKGALFVFIDQSDSVFGCLFIGAFFIDATLTDFVALFVMATSLHLVINFLLYHAGLKKQMA